MGGTTVENAEVWALPLSFQATLATGFLSLPASQQACPLVSSPLKGIGNIEQRYRLPESFSALQTSSTGFICSK